MIQVAVPLLSAAAISDVMAPVDALRRIDDAFAVTLVGLDGPPVGYGSAFVEPDRTVRGRSAFDLVLVPSLGFEVDAALAANAGFLPWIRRQRERGSDVASWCTGAFVLGAAGLLDGKRATTHWAAADEFRRRYPTAALEIDRMVVDDNAVITAGGASTVYLLVLSLVERYCGRQRSVQAARDFVADLHRPGQLAYSDERGRPQHGDALVDRVQRYIDGHLTEDLSLDRLAVHAGTTIRTLSRRFRAATDLSPAAFIQSARVEAAKKALLRPGPSFDAITLGVGYTDPRAFRRLFKRVTGLSPQAYRRLFTSSRR